MIAVVGMVRRGRGGVRRGHSLGEGLFLEKVQR